MSTINTARQQFLRLWHQHETPSQVWGRDRRNRNGAATYMTITTVTIRRRERRRKKEAGVAQ